PELFESELFGYEKGTFTDAQTRKLGRLELAPGGTVYFDDVTALPPNLQAKLLRAIQEKRFTRLGGNQSVGFDARVITSAADPAGLRRDLFRSEEHTSELQSQSNLVCRLLLEKKK